jgi:hypothetical protein
MPVPPLSSSLVNFRKLDAGKSSTFSTNSRDTMLPCMLPVSIVHFAIFVIGCLSVSCQFERTWTGRIHGEGHVEGLLPIYIESWSAMAKSTTGLRIQMKR